MSNYSDVKVSDNMKNKFSDTTKKKTLYFSDGTLEIDEVDESFPTELDSKSAPVSAELAWIPWMWYQTLSAGSKALEVCDYMGESLASFFGITTPKYQFELNEYFRMKKEEEQEAKNDIEMGDWSANLSSNETNIEAISTVPKRFIKTNVSDG